MGDKLKAEVQEVGELILLKDVKFCDTTYVYGNGQLITGLAKILKSVGVKCEDIILSDQGSLSAVPDELATSGMIFISQRLMICLKVETERYIVENEILNKKSRMFFNEAFDFFCLYVISKLRRISFF